MAGFATHVIFGEEVLAEHFDVMPSRLIQKHAGVYGVGCQGPDLFFYNLFMNVSCKEKNLGARMHHENSSRFFAYLMEAVWEARDSFQKEIGMSYLYGVLAHYTLDSILHPYVYARIGYNPSIPYSKKKTVGLHHCMEAAMDAKMLIAKAGILPSQYREHAKESQRMTRCEKEALAGFLVKAAGKSYRIRLKKQNVLAALWMMQRLTAGFFWASDGQRRKLQRIEWKLSKDYALSNFMITDELARKKNVMNSQNRVWHNPWDKTVASNESAWELYDRAVTQYRTYCLQVRKALPLYEDSLFTVMVEKRKMQEVRKRICRAAKGLGNLSYETGLAMI